MSYVFSNTHTYDCYRIFSKGLSRENSYFDKYRAGERLCAWHKSAK